jgi:hypothetical protein
VIQRGKIKYHWIFDIRSGPFASSSVPPSSSIGMFYFKKSAGRCQDLIPGRLSSFEKIKERVANTPEG